MSIRRFHCEMLPAAPGSTVTLDREQADHARKSLRLSIGDTLELFDGSGHLATATITELSRTLIATITDHRVMPPLCPALTLAVAIPKGSRADTLIDQATQLGVTHLIPLITTRTVVEPRDKKIDRFRRIMLEACKQSLRPHFMTIADPTPLADVFNTSGGADVRLIADLPEAAALQGDGESGENSLQNLHISPDMRTTLINARHILVLVGPEGGWTDDERAAARDADFQPIALGHHVLRVETAALAAAAIIRIADR